MTGEVGGEDKKEGNGSEKGEVTGEVGGEGKKEGKGSEKGG